MDKHATYTRLYALCGSAYHVDELARELEALQPADVAPWARGLLAACHAEMMAFGNVTRQEAQTLADELMQVVHSCGHSESMYVPSCRMQLILYGNLGCCPACTKVLKIVSESCTSLVIMTASKAVTLNWVGLAPSMLWLLATKSMELWWWVVMVMVVHAGVGTWLLPARQRTQA